MINRAPCVGKQNLIPYNKYYDIPTNSIDLSHLRTFGCSAWAVIPPELRDGKLKPTAVHCVMVGFDTDRISYRLYHPDHNTTFSAIDVLFSGRVFPLAYCEESKKAYNHALCSLNGIPSRPRTDVTIPPTFLPEFTSVFESPNILPLASSTKPFDCG